MGSSSAADLLRAGEVAEDGGRLGEPEAGAVKKAPRTWSVYRFCRPRLQDLLRG
jgi:hypothetical protein